MKIVKENMEENQLSNVDDQFYELLDYLRTNVFPKLDQDELLEFMEKLGKWTVQVTN